ncbi:unnamed protein product, partial [Brassica oleracea var. botrytis]
MKQREFHFPGLILQDEELKQYTLMEIERLLKENDKSLADFPCMPKPNTSVLQKISNTTFLYRTIIAKLRSVGKVVIPVASAGIAALLLPGGRTAHSRFKLPLKLSETSLYEIKYGSMLANLISKTDLIIWDEAPMAHRQTFETLDHTLRDLQA